jgi:hypothetical protein
MADVGSPAMPIRCQDVVENYRELHKSKPRYTFEYGVSALLNVFTLHDFAMYHVMEEEFGQEKAVNLYAKIWERRTHLEWPGLLKEVGLKPTDTVSVEDFIKMMEIYFETFGNPIYLTESSDERITFRVTDCPYTTQILWNMFSADENLAYNDKIQVQCNTAIFDTMLKLANLDKDWNFGFPAQLCRTGQYCEFTFVRKAF